jgi:energy-coupling factor transporter ATP-binding protein EcfA2
MLESIKLRNFKLHASTEIEARRLTVFIGPNNSGKSSIFHALMVLRQAAVRDDTQPILLNLLPARQPTDAQQLYLYPPAQMIDPGPFDGLVSRGESIIEIELSGRFYEQETASGGLRRVALTVGLAANQLSYHRGGVEFQLGEGTPLQGFRWDWARGMDRLNITRAGGNIKGVTFALEPTDNFHFLGSAGFTPPPNFPSHEFAQISTLVQRLSSAPVTLLQSMHPVYPLRGLEEPAYPLPDYASPDADRMMLADRTLALLSILAYNPEIEARVSEWMNGLLNVNLKHRLIPRKRVAIIVEPSGKRRSESLFVNEGTGVSQLPFILVPIALCPSGETVMISEPEAHLHPRAQSEIARLFTRVALKEEKQFLIETHSEHVLNALLQAIAKGQLKKEDLAIYYFEAKAGEVSVRLLNIDDYGRVEGGLPGFFDQSLDELAGYLEALKRK